MRNHDNIFRAGILTAITAFMLVSKVVLAAPQETAASATGLRQNSAGPGGKISSSTSKKGNLFEVPDTALVRPLGTISPAPCTPKLSQVCEGATPTPFETLNGGYPMSLAGLGIPLGGIGAGSFMVNQSGTFGPWNFGGGVDERWEVRVLSQAAFHIREKVGDEPANNMCESSETLM